jgi:methylated-DNA-[protein]-cysteine S-methyltransferase
MSPTHATLFTLIPSPIGPLLLTSEGEGLSGLFTDGQKDGPVRAGEWREDAAPFTQAVRELDEYFRGRRRLFEMPLATTRGTPFQRDVWRALRAIPYGATTSYGEIAQEIERPKAVRAVGAAVGMNPWGIVVPCHRVVGKAGALTGFAGGLPRKRWLLEHEGVHVERGKGESDARARIAGKQLTLEA